MVFINRYKNIESVWMRQKKYIMSLLPEGRRLIQLMKRLKRGIFGIIVLVLAVFFSACGKKTETVEFPVIREVSGEETTAEKNTIKEVDKAEPHVFHVRDLENVRPNGVCSSERLAEPLKLLENAVMITGTQYSHAALLKDGTVWTWGGNVCGECGIPVGQVPMFSVVCRAGCTGDMDGRTAIYSIFAYKIGKSIFLPCICF